MGKLKIFDSTLRDGSHAIGHKFTKKNIEDYCKAVDNSGLHTIIVGHGNGLGASSLQVGLSLLQDNDMLSIAKENLRKTKLGTFLIPGFGTINDNIKPAIKCGVDLFCIASHCTEADVTRQHIEYVRHNDKEVYGVLMMYHMASTERILIEAKKMQSYGARGIIVMDSAGASTPELVKKTIATLYDGLDIPVGIHPHNNLGLAVANAYIAIKEGAEIVDGTLRGFGAGAGNCQLEALIALLIKNNIKTKVDFYKVLDASEEIVRTMMENDKGLSAISIVSGMSGVFSAFTKHVQVAAKEFNVDARDIFIELGKLKVVGGQEDMILTVASELAKQKLQNQLMSF